MPSLGKVFGWKGPHLTPLGALCNPAAGDVAISSPQKRRATPISDSVSVKILLDRDFAMGICISVAAAQALPASQSTPLEEPGREGAV